MNSITGILNYISLGGGLMIDNKQKKQLASAVRVKGLPKGCYQVRLSI